MSSEKDVKVTPVDESLFIIGDDTPLEHAFMLLSDYMYFLKFEKVGDDRYNYLVNINMRDSVFSGYDPVALYLQGVVDTGDMFVRQLSFNTIRDNYFMHNGTPDGSWIISKNHQPCSEEEFLRALEGSVQWKVRRYIKKHPSSF